MVMKEVIKITSQLNKREILLRIEHYLKNCGLDLELSSSNGTYYIQKSQSLFDRESLDIFILQIVVV
jgi:hypothetical protein